jgi:hypothetical protein
MRQNFHVYIGNNNGQNWCKYCVLNFLKSHIISAIVSHFIQKNGHTDRHSDKKLVIFILLLHLKVMYPVITY